MAEQANRHDPMSHLSESKGSIHLPHFFDHAPKHARGGPHGEAKEVANLAKSEDEKAVRTTRRQASNNGDSTHGGYVPSKGSVHELHRPHTRMSILERPSAVPYIMDDKIVDIV